jgi:hypothetical protein
VTSLGEDTLNGHGYVKVQPTLQLLNHPSIFAVGDIMEWTEQKQAAKLRWHVPIAVANILGFLNGATLTKKYTGAPEMIVITNGRVSEKMEGLSLIADVAVYRTAAWAISHSLEGFRWVIGLPG